MDSQTLQYIAFIVAASILIWGVLELGRRLNHHKKIDSTSPNTWIKLDSSRSDTAENMSPVIKADEQETLTPDSKSNMQLRAQQNGHYSESKKII